MVIIYAGLFYLITCRVTAERCITCERDRLEECVNGKEAAQYDGQTQQCSPSLPYCEVTIQERLGPEPDSEPELVDVTRGCVENSKFECTNSSNIRTCTATCQGDLCNDFEDAAARVAAHEKEQAEAGPSTGVIVVSVLVPLAVIAAVYVGVQRFCARRKKNQRLSSRPAETEQALKP